MAAIGITFKKRVENYFATHDTTVDFTTQGTNEGGSPRFRCTLVCPALPALGIPRKEFSGRGLSKWLAQENAFEEVITCFLNEHGIVIP
jgi:hypothetical protein